MWGPDSDSGAISTGTAWGDWRLDDLEQAFQRAMRILSPSSAVNWICVYAPGTPEDVPTVHVAVDDFETLGQVRDAIADGPQLAHLQSDLFGTGFTADVDDLYLSVRCFGDGDV